jgi:SOS-response transcriptional repressor LexA
MVLIPNNASFANIYFLVDGPKETVRIDESILPEDTTFGVRISDDSMESVFHDGQIAWVLQQESVANGEIGIFALNGEAYIKKLQNDKDGIFLISLNEKYAPIPVGEDDRLDIFGKVLGKCNPADITKNCK